MRGEMGGMMARYCSVIMNDVMQGQITGLRLWQPNRRASASRRLRFVTPPYNMDLLTAISYCFGGALAFFLTVTIYYSFNWNRKHYWVNKNVPYEEPLAFFPLMKALLFSKKYYWEVDAEWCKKHGRVFGCYQAMQPILYITEPDIIRRIMVKDFHLLPDRRTFDLQDPIFNSFLTVLKGDDWKRVRSVITPAFSTGRLKKMVGLMDDCARMTVQNFTSMTDKDGFVDCKRIFSGFTLDVIANTAFGTKLNSSQDPDNIFIQNARAFFNINIPWRFLLIVSLPKLARLLGVGPFPPNRLQFFIDLTNSVVKKRKETKEDRGDFLQNLMEAQMKGAKDQTVEEDNMTPEERDAPSEECQSFLKQYSKNKTLSTDEFVASCLLFFLAGFETTATTISMVAYFLALNPECQQKVLEEVDETWRKHPEMDYEAVSKLKYIDAAISETLRLVPPAPRIERKAICDYPIEELDFTVPKDMMVGFPIFAMHQDPEFFPNPEKFEPERFLPENKDSIRPYTYLPFGAGPRNCLGMRFALMEIKICLLQVFKEVTFEPCSETKIPPDIYKGSGIYQPKTVNLKVVKRIK